MAMVKRLEECSIDLYNAMQTLKTLEQIFENTIYQCALDSLEDAYEHLADQISSGIIFIKS